MPDLLGLLDRYGVRLLFVVIMLKEIGVPVPVPGDLLMLVAGARAAAVNLTLWEVLLAAPSAWRRQALRNACRWGAQRQLVAKPEEEQL